MNTATYEESGRRQSDDVAYSALSRIKAHEEVCDVRHEYIRYRINRMEIFLIGELVTMIGGMGSIIYLLVDKMS